MKLGDYKAKRNFSRTPEPSPGRATGTVQPVFVVHKHSARSLHYDLRMEADGVLKSWALPKGPSLNPVNKRLAVQVEDHPLEYRDFEGTIPEGEYGAGGVIIWDRGTYRHPADPHGSKSEALLREGLEKGDAKFLLEGQKLKGEFALVKTGKDDKSWLLLKKRDTAATDREILAENRSVVSGKTLEDLAGNSGHEDGRPERIDRVRLREALEMEEFRGAPLAPMPHGVRPMLATLARAPFDDPDWIFEVKWDGYRALAQIEAGRVNLYSRNGQALNAKYAAVVTPLGRLSFDALMDGEIVVVDDQGRSNFQMLQDYGKTERGHLRYYVFDVLHLEGRDLTGLPLIRRKEILKRILPGGGRIRYSDHVPGEGVLFFEMAREKGLEGVVAKHVQSVYRPGRRTRQWLKVKVQQTLDAVILGFTAPRGSRPHFGALVLGVFAGKEWTYIGHVGGGFDSGTLETVHRALMPLVRDRRPLRNEPQTNAPVTWVEPKLVCEVVFQGWTDQGLLRQPVFKRLREDKQAEEAVGEPIGRNDGGMSDRS